MKRLLLILLLATAFARAQSPQPNSYAAAIVSPSGTGNDFAFATGTGTPAAVQPNAYAALMQCVANCTSLSPTFAFVQSLSGGGSGGNGTVNSGQANGLAYYPANGTAVSSANPFSGLVLASATGAPSAANLSPKLPASFNLVCVGDSRTAGNVISPSPSWCTSTVLGAQSRFSGHIGTLTNVAAGGTGIADGVSNYASAVKPKCQAATATVPTILFIWYGYNDFQYNGATGQSEYTAVKNYASQAATDGCTPYIFTDAAGIYTVSGASQQRIAYNSLLRSDNTTGVGIVDLDELNIDPNDSALMNGDLVHQSPAAQYTIAKFIDYSFGGTKPAQLAQASSKNYIDNSNYRFNDLTARVVWANPLGKATTGQQGLWWNSVFLQSFGSSLCVSVAIGDTCAATNIGEGYFAGNLTTAATLSANALTSATYAAIGGTTDFSVGPGGHAVNISSNYAELYFNVLGGGTDSKLTRMICRVDQNGGCQFQILNDANSGEQTLWGYTRSGLSVPHWDFVIPVGAPALRTNTTSNADLAGQLTLSAGTASYTFISPYTSAPICTATDTTATAPVRVQTTTTTLTVSGTTTDVINYICVGRN